MEGTAPRTSPRMRETEQQPEAASSTVKNPLKCASDIPVARSNQEQDIAGSTPLRPSPHV